MMQPTNVQNPYPQQGGANAVSINIYNPQAYGATNSMQPAQAPYAYTNSLYQMPQASAYPQGFQPYFPQQQMMQPYFPQQPMMQPYFPQQSLIQGMDVPQIASPIPQAMPESVLTPVAQPVAQTVSEAQVAPAVVAVPEAPAVVESAPVVEPAPVVEVVEPAVETVAQTINTDALVQGLKSADPNLRAETINQIAAYAQATPDVALQVVSEPIMQSLVDIIKEDTTALAGPTPEQIAVAEKITSGAQLTPEETAIAEQLSPRDMANKNRIFSLYTLAMIQKLQRDELNQYIQTQQANGEQSIAPLKAEDLIGFADVANIIQNDPRPEVRVAAIQAVQHIAEPQDATTLQTILADSLNSQDEAIKQAATDAMAKIAA